LVSPYSWHEILQVSPKLLLLIWMYSIKVRCTISVAMVTRDHDFVLSARWLMIFWRNLSPNFSANATIPPKIW
jgi:hypothetical protein